MIKKSPSQKIPKARQYLTIENNSRRIKSCTNTNMYNLLPSQTYFYLLRPNQDLGRVFMHDNEYICQLVSSY